MLHERHRGVRRGERRSERAPSARRGFRRFTHLGATFRLCCTRYGIVTDRIVKDRAALEAYIRRHPEFGTSLVPVELRPRAPAVAVRMCRAGRAAGVGPMAAVAGAMAQSAAEAALDAGDRDVVVDNGGDIYLSVRTPIRVRVGTGSAAIADALALVIGPGDCPLAVCSSSGAMGHSFSFGRCDLATVVAADGALADAAATLAANQVRAASDVGDALEAVMGVPGVRGVLIAHGGHVGMAGALPRLVRMSGAAGRPSALARG